MHSVDKTGDSRQCVILIAPWGRWCIVISVVKLTFIKFLLPANHWCEHCACLTLSFHTILRRTHGPRLRVTNREPQLSEEAYHSQTQAAERSLYPFYVGMEVNVQPVKSRDLGPAMELGIGLFCTQLFFLLFHVIILLLKRQKPRSCVILLWFYFKIPFM